MGLILHIITIGSSTGFLSRR